MQSMGYGFVLVGMAKLGMGDIIMGLAGLVAIVGGIQAAWSYVMSDEPKPGDPA